MDFTEKTIQSEYIFDGRIIKLRKDKIEQSDGKQFIREIVEHNGGVGIVTIDKNGKFIFVSQYRKPFEEELIEIPAGKLEKGEIPEECARRELEEETGFKPISLRHLTTIYPSPGFLTEKIYIYFCNEMTNGKINFDEGEHLSTLHVEPEQAYKMISEGRIKDAKTIIGILMSKQFL